MYKLYAMQIMHWIENYLLPETAKNQFLITHYIYLSITIMPLLIVNKRKKANKSIVEKSQSISGFLPRDKEILDITKCLKNVKCNHC